ncbi:hypothetical protein V7123_01585 [Bacillus toyonensis]|uniref:hypothetical protein n=1 Tax=Bacillus toyonensis TaxID=155322 RepID=UPI0030004D48
MAKFSFTIDSEIATGCIAFDEPGNAVWFGTIDGEIRSLRLLDGRETLHGQGYGPLAAIILSPNGIGIDVVQQDGDVFRATREDADRAAATVQVILGEFVAAAAPHPDGNKALVLLASGSLLLLDTDTGIFDTLSDVLIDPVGLTIDTDERLAVVLGAGEVGSELTLIEIDSGIVQATMPVPADTTAILSAPLSGFPAVLTATGGNGELALLGLAGQPTVSGEKLATEVRGISRWYSLILAATANTIEVREWNLDAGDFDIAIPPGPVFVGGYVRAEANLAAVGLLPNDVEFLVQEGVDAGFCSAGVEPPSPAGWLRFVIGAGPRPGQYHVVCRRIADEKILARARFRVTSHWPDADIGPGVVVTGKQQVFAHGSWGGGPTGPQNVNVLAAPDTWRVLVVLLELKDRGFGTTASGRQTAWSNVLIGATNSVKAYYEETSLFNTPGSTIPRGTTIELVTNAVLGPVKVDIGWGDAFEPKDKNDIWGGWNPKSTFAQQCATALCDMLADQGTGDNIIRNTDAVVFAIRTASDEKVTIAGKDFPAQFVWPQATSATFWSKTQLATSFAMKPMVFMNDTDPTNTPADKRLPSLPVLCHELGHTLGLEDLYNTGDFPAEIEARAIGELDFMGAEFSLPHASIANKLRLGWVHPNWIECFDFDKNPTGQLVRLQAVESLTRQGPEPGSKAGIEIRIQDGWNYYFEYRRTIAGQMADQGLNAYTGGSQIVLGTDVRADGAVKPARPVIMRLGVDADGDGPILKASGEDYEETDVTNKERQHDFRVVFDRIDPVDSNTVHVKVEYVSAHRPQLQISPAPGRGNWKSPDINLKGPGGDNKVLKGRRHKIIVKVFNAGTLAAKNVRVGLAWLPFTTSPGSWMNLPDPKRQDVPPGATVLFEQDWDVPANLKVSGIEVEHFCIKASIDAYVDPLDSTNSEIVVFDNWAQSNFDSTTVSNSSPSERRWTGLSVTNTLSSRATYLTIAEQDSEHFRAYIGNAWVRLEPHQSHMIEVAYESLAGDAMYGSAFELAFRKGIIFERPNRLTFNSFVVREDSGQCTSPVVVWGAGLYLRAGRRTWIDDLRMVGEVVRGHVGGSDNSFVTSVNDGYVNVVLWTSQQRDELVVTAQVDSSGRFTALLPQEIMRAVGHERIHCEALYLGTIRWAPCRSGESTIG